MKMAGNLNTTAEDRQGMEDPGIYYNDKLRLWIQAYTLAKRKFSEFKTSMILRLYHMELWRACLQLMPKELQKEYYIKLYHLILTQRKETQKTVEWLQCRKYRVCPI